MAAAASAISTGNRPPIKTPNGPIGQAAKCSLRRRQAKAPALRSQSFRLHHQIIANWTCLCTGRTCGLRRETFVRSLQRADGVSVGAGRGAASLRHAADDRYAVHRLRSHELLPKVGLDPTLAHHRLISKAATLCALYSCGFLRRSTVFAVNDRYVSIGLALRQAKRERNCSTQEALGSIREHP